MCPALRHVLRMFTYLIPKTTPIFYIIFPSHRKRNWGSERLRIFQSLTAKEWLMSLRLQSPSIFHCIRHCFQVPPRHSSVTEATILSFLILHPNHLILEKAMAPHSSTLSWKRLQSVGSLESDTTEWLHFHFSLSCIGEGNGNPLQCSCLENPRDGEAWWAAVYGVAQSRTRLKRLSSSSSNHLIYHPNLNLSVQGRKPGYNQRTRSKEITKKHQEMYFSPVFLGTFGQMAFPVPQLVLWIPPVVK